MTDYNCAVHGAYSDADFPASVKSCHCPECLHELDRRTMKEQQAFDREHRLWHDWCRRSGVPARCRNRTIENWRPEGRAQQAAAKLVKTYANRIAGEIRAGNGVTLLGPPGVGKTHLGCGLIAAAYRAGSFGRYARWADVVDRTKASFAAREHGNRQLLDDLKQSPLLMIDEIGCRTGSEFEQGLLFDLIDERYCQRRATIVASNLTADALNFIGERVADRLREVNLTVHIPGESYRPTASSNHELCMAAPALEEPEPPSILVPTSINGELMARPLAIHKPEAW